MPVFQPSAIIGNGRALVGVGERGELMSFHYPHIDYPQNLHQGMPACYLGAPGEGRLEWTFEPTWSAEQHYLGRTNVLRTTCRHTRLAVTVAFTDFLLPDRDVLVREIELRNTAATPFVGVLYQYLDLQLGEVQERNGVRWDDSRGIFVQYWRNLAFAIGGDPFDQFGCGKAGPQSHNSAKLGMARGRLDANRQEIGDVDLAVGWKISLAPGESARRLLLISAATTEANALSALAAAAAEGYETLLRAAGLDARTFLTRARRPDVPADLEEGYWRCVLALRLLFDDAYGTFVAAPEFDPAFERSGGYGYCWPRDAAEVISALAAVGLCDMGERVLEWARQHQNDDGSWEQRYWLNGERGPAWCTLEGCTQIDQVGSVVTAMERLITSLAPEEQLAALARLWPTVQKAGSYLAAQIDPKTGLHRRGSDLWETFVGSFTYTNAAVWAGLRAAARVAYQVGQPRLGEPWAAAAAELKRAVLAKLWLGDTFARGLAESGEPDPTADSSILGLIDPFPLLDLADPSERAMAEACVRSVIRRLALAIDGRTAIRRFEGDQYLGGSAGGVNTLWVARALLRLALAFQENDRPRSHGYQREAVGYLRTVLSRSTRAGLLPELIGGAADVPGHWAAPHGWAMASYIMCLILLDQLDIAPEEPAASPSRGRQDPGDPGGASGSGPEERR